jgi:hypothetical protein
MTWSQCFGSLLISYGGEGSAFGNACVLAPIFCNSFLFPFCHVTHSSQLQQVEPRKILETRTRFMDEKFGSSQKAEAEVQKLLVALFQARAFVESGVEIL